MTQTNQNAVFLIVRLLTDVLNMIDCILNYKNMESAEEQQIPANYDYYLSLLKNPGRRVSKVDGDILK